MNGSTSEHDHKYGAEGCGLCGAFYPFDFPEPLLEAIVHRKAVLFAGAGISTESAKVFPHTLYDQAKEDAELNPGDNLSFPEVMGAYESRQGRSALLQMVQERFDYIESFPELLDAASSFHRELGTAWPISEVVTTNWDTYFERFAACRPITVPRDYHFWNLPGRKVFKIHGSITNPSSLVATKDDYAKCLVDLEKGVVGATLKHLLATKTVVFIGYSLNDEDFLQIYKFLRGELGSAMPRAYLVNLDESRPPPEHALGLEVIRTDGVYFLKELKRRLVESHVMLSDIVYERARKHLARVYECHGHVSERVDFEKYPAALFCLSYQDGLLHAFQRMLARRGTGEYSNSHHLHHQAHSYQAAIKEKRRARRYWDVAYVEGYLNGLLTPLVESDLGPTRFPPYFLFGSSEELYSFSQFKKALRDGESLHRAAYRQAKKIVPRLQGGRLLIQHTPFL